MLYNTTLTAVCKICQNKTRPIFDKQFKINYHQCLECGFLFIEPQNLPSRDEELKIYLQHNNSIENEGYVSMLRDFIDRTVKPYSKGESVLDFGSGPNPVLAQIMEQDGFNVDIYDPFFSPTEVFKNKAYDVITSTEVFEHLQHPLKMFEQLYQALKPGGIIALMTMFHPDDDEVFQNWWYRRDITHISFYTHKTFTQIAKSFNMNILLLDPKNICVMQKIQE